MLGSVKLMLRHKITWRPPIGDHTYGDWWAMGVKLIIFCGDSYELMTTDAAWLMDVVSFEILSDRLKKTEKKHEQEEGLWYRSTASCGIALQFMLSDYSPLKQTHGIFSDRAQVEFSKYMYVVIYLFSFITKCMTRSCAPYSILFSSSIGMHVSSFYYIIGV
jgi:hypothetical protein